MYTKSVCNNSSGRYGVRLQLIQPFLEISILNLAHKLPLKASFEIRKSLKRMPSLAYTEMDQTKYRFLSMFAFVYTFWTLLHVFTCNKLAGQFQTI